MARLMCGVDQGTPNAGQATDRPYGMHVIELQQLEIESANEDSRRHLHLQNALKGDFIGIVFVNFHIIIARVALRSPRVYDVHRAESRAPTPLGAPCEQGNFP